MMKQLLLAGAAGLATVSLAHAADVPMEAAEAVEYVKVCTEFGEGFFYIPGTDTCLKLSGHVRANYTFTDADDREDDNVGFSHNARANFDARTATEFGTLRSFVETNITSTKASVGKAYIQLGGLTAGYAASAFNFYDTYYANTSLVGDYYASQSTVNLISYTATFGGGFYATLSIEDGIGRRSSIGFERGDLGSANSVETSPALGAGWKYDGYAGQTAPDVVAAIGASQSWGKAQIMAAAHQITYSGRALYAASSTGGPGSTASNFPSDFTRPGDDWGYAVGAGVGINLPIMAASHFAIEATYAQGAMSYLGAVSSSRTVGLNVPDAVVVYDLNGANPSVTTADLSEGYAIAGEFQVALTPTVVATLYGSYADIDWGVPSNLASQTQAADEWGFAINQNSYILGGNVAYTLTKGLTITAEGTYTRTETETFDPGTAGTADGVVKTTSADDFFAGIRLERAW